MTFLPAFHKLFQKIPQPCTITSDQIISYYQTLYSKVQESYEKKDFNRIDYLLDFSNHKCPIPNLKFPLSERDPSNNILLLNFINLLYKIITIYPVKYYKTQYSAAKYLSEILKRNKIDGLTLELQPFYKILKYYLEDSSFVIPPSLKDTIEDTFYSLSSEISAYFPDEIEILNDNSTIKTNTTNFLLKKFLPKEDFILLTILLPPHKGQYKLYLDDILNSNKEKPNQIRYLRLIRKTIETNIEDDFSCFIPFLSQYIKDEIVKNYSSKLDSYSLNLCKIFCLLFLSPPTRTQLIELFENFMPSFKILVHPSSLNTIVVNHFIKKSLYFCKFI